MVLQATKWEIEAAALLSDISYGVQPHVDNDPVRKFKAKFLVVGEICFFCTSSGQKYVAALVRRGTDTTVLFCAFAGTHLQGDWERVNVHLFHDTDAREVGAPGHAGFLQRALDVPIEGIERLARDGEASRVVLCGHSLGGAVAHFCLLRWLFGRRSEVYGRESVVSIAAGAPFFGGRDMLDHVIRHGWSDCFINLVNGNDPVPRVMNLAASLVDSSISCTMDVLFSTCVAFLNKTNPTVGITQSLVEAIKRSPQKDLEEWASYLPIGHYVLFPAEEKGTVSVISDDAQQVAEILGPVRLLGEKASFVNGFFDQSALAHHEISAYLNIIETNQHEMTAFFSKERGALSLQPHIRFRSAPVSAPCVQELNPIVHEISCETFTSHVKQFCRILKVSGHNLDFVGRNSITIDTDNADCRWSKECVLDSRVIRRSTSDLVVEQTLRVDARAQPAKDIRCSFRSDIVMDGSGVASTKPTLYRKSCHAAANTPRNQHFCLYGGHFFLDSLQHAWILKDLSGDCTIEHKLEELALLVQHLNCVKSESTEFLQMKPEWSSIEEVGGRSSESDGRDELFRWLVPPDGLVVRTKLESRSSVAVLFLSIAIGGGIIATGGLGIIGGILGYGASLSGGYGTASVLASGGSGIAYFLLRSRLRSEYCVLLEDLIKIYTGCIPKTMSELELEGTLLRSHSEYHRTHEKGGNLRKAGKQSGIPCFDQYNVESQQKFEERVKVIRYIHEIKEERAKGAFIVVCGPRDSGKTTLVSQLLHEPRLAAIAAGYRGGEEETRTVVPHQFADVPGAAILDSPGLTGIDPGVRSMFDRCAMHLATTFVYVRAYEGLPTEVDLKTITRILEFSADNQACRILICLNQCKQKLTEDAAGERFDLLAEEIKKDWLDNLYSLRSKIIMPTWVNALLSRCTIAVEFVELNGDRLLEEQFDLDERTRGIKTAFSIGKWIAESVGKSNQLKNHMANFSYVDWQAGVQQERQRRRNDEASQLISAFQAQ